MGDWRENLLFCIFTVLPFGLTSAPFIFTKVMRCLVKHWRINAIRIACFLDHGLGVASSYKMTLFHSNFVKKSLQNAGFIINEEKSVWKPSQTLIWLGIRINLKSGFYCIPTEELSAIKNSIVLLIERLPYTTARQLGKACGKLISMKFVLGNIVQLKTRNLNKIIENQPSWDSRVNLTHYVKATKKLICWKNNINEFNKKPLRAYDLPRTVLFSDASSSAIAIFENESGRHTCHKN